MFKENRLMFKSPEVPRGDIEGDADSPDKPIFERLGMTRAGDGFETAGQGPDGKGYVDKLQDGMVAAGKNQQREAEAARERETAKAETRKILEKESADRNRENPDFDPGFEARLAKAEAEGGAKKDEIVKEGGAEGTRVAANEDVNDEIVRVESVERHQA